MICKNCGSTIPDDSMFCTECGTTINTQPAYEPEFTDYEDPNCVQTANDYISKAKKGMILSIIAFALPFAPILFFLIPIINIFGSSTLGLASFVLLIISYVILKGARKLPEVPSNAINPQLYADYVSAKGKAKVGKILNTIQTVFFCLGFVAGLAIGLIAALGVLGVFGGTAGLVAMSGY